MTVAQEYGTRSPEGARTLPHTLIAGAIGRATRARRNRV